MYVKLKFHSSVRWTYAARVMDAIIRNNVTTASGSSSGSLTFMLNNQGTDAAPPGGISFNASIKSAVDANNCAIYRINDPDGVKSHIHANTVTGPSSGRMVWTLEFPVYDETSTKYYYQWDGNQTGNAANSAVIRIGDSITGGTMSSNSLWSSANDESTSITAGNNPSYLVLGNGDAFNANSKLWATTGGANNYYYHFYITNNVIAFNASNEDTSTGFPSSYSSATKFTGNFIASQY